MAIELSNLRASDIKKFSYDETNEVVSLIEDKLCNTFTIINATEDFDTFRGYAQEIIEKIANDAFEDSVTLDQKQKLKSRVEKIIFNISLMLRVNVLAQERIADGVNKVEQTHQDMQNELQAVFEKEKKDIADLEHKTLTHVLSIMGIFSAIITIILSLITTTSSWINNSTQSDMFFAFIVPNGVAIVAVFALMILVYYLVDYHKNDKSDDDNGKQNDKPVDTKEEKKQSKKHKPVYIMLSVVVLISALLLSVYIATQNIKSPAHVRYIISSEQYEVIEDTEKSPHKCPHNAECNCQSVQETKNYFEFTFEDKLYRFEYDESHKHGEDLHFCIVHCALE